MNKKRQREGKRMRERTKKRRRKKKKERKRETQSPKFFQLFPKLLLILLIKI